jgi:hypothetical protein
MILFCLSYSEIKAQYFNNVNNELSYQLYEKSDTIGKFRVFIVIEDLLEKDKKIIEKWDSIPVIEKTAITQRWSIEGKRIESERYPYITYPPVFPK